MIHGSLFSGIGGFDLAAEWMGWENVFHCEWNEFGKKILKYYWPNAISYGDITKTDFSIWRGRIDILTGGFPCQPYSVAGKRKGKEDDRHLWPEMFRAVREIQPRYVVGENVSGLINWNGGLVFEEVQTDLETEGYKVIPFLLPAAGLNAPHRRERVWFIAYLYDRGRSEYGLSTGREMSENRTNESEITPDSRLLRQERTKQQSMGIEQLCKEWDVANASTYGLQGSRKGEDRVCEKTPERQIEILGKCFITYHTGRRQSDKEHRKEESGRITEKGFSNYWENFPTQSPICGRDDGLSSKLDGITFSKWRNESIKAMGNAIVPQVAFQIFKAIQQYEEIENNLKT